MALHQNAVSSIKLDSDCDLYDNRLQYLLCDFYLFLLYDIRLISLL